MQAALQRRDDTGMTTAEYAVGTVGACGIAGVLMTLVDSQWFGDLIKSIFEFVLQASGLS
jgi:Flp pilus assembly pilin Flp